MGVTTKDISTEENADSPTDRRQSDCLSPKTSWTILLDIAADGQLANFAVESLKQLRDSLSQKPGCADVATVKVAVQFSVDAPDGQRVLRYVFDEHCVGTLKNCIKNVWNAPRGTSEKDALVHFLQWAYDYKDDPYNYKDDEDGTNSKDLKAEHYALILWGHGPILLLQPPPGPGHASVSLYLTPTDLAVALQNNPPPNDHRKFDLVAFDACSMSMLEMAYEIRDCADYMVASQDEVPDLSFPYNAIVPLFRQHGDALEPLLQAGVGAYVQAYQDYINGAITDTAPVTLSALKLSALKPPDASQVQTSPNSQYDRRPKCGSVNDALRMLVCALRHAVHEPSLPFILLRARENTEDFVSGLYVDLSDFASALISALDATASVNLRNYCAQKTIPPGPDCWKCAIRRACVAIIQTLEEDSEGAGDLLVLANGTENGDCNGVSLYLPYLSTAELTGVLRPMIKGEDPSRGLKGEDPSRGLKGEDASRGIKDFSTMLNDAAPFQLLFQRRNLIADTEDYYENLQLSKDTGWYRFIVEQWTPILVINAPGSLDVLYSAEQAAINTFRSRANSVKVKEGLCSDCPAGCK